MAKNTHTDPIFQLFKDSFRIDLFYKYDDGKEYHIILDQVLLLKFMIIGKNFIIINTIQPLTTSYMPKIYDTLIDTLVNQTDFSVLIERTGNINAIKDACIKHEVPTVNDDRFITIPLKLHKMYERFYKSTPDNFGFYLLAVNSDFDDIPNRNEKVVEPVEKEVEVKPIIPENPIYLRDRYRMLNTELDIDERIVSLFDNRTTIERKDNDMTLCYIHIMDINMVYSEDDNTIIIKSFNPRKKISAVDYMESITILEGLCDTFDVIFEDITDVHVYEVCDIRGYTKIIKEEDYINKRRKNNFGTYKMKKR